MSRFICIATAAAMTVFSSGVQADDDAEKLAAQKKQAEANWSAVEAGESATVETAHFLIYAPKEMEKNLKLIGASVEKHYAEAAKPLGYDAKKSPWVGKLTVYLFGDREHFQAFVRRVEKRRLVAGETSTHAVDGDMLHVAAGPPQAKEDSSAEVQVGQQVATAMLQLKAGAKIELPEWLLVGFGRATHYRVAPQDKSVVADRKLARDVVANRKRTAKMVYDGSLDVEEAPALSGALAELLAYGPGTQKFVAFVDGFKPTDEAGTATKTADALDAAGLKADRLETSWKAWVAVPR